MADGAHPIATPEPVDKPMAQKRVRTTGFFVRDPANGALVELIGAGSMADKPLAISDEIDLTKPIFEQVYGKP